MSDRDNPEEDWYIVNADGSNLQRVTTDGGIKFTPMAPWSPNGRRFVYDTEVSMILSNDDGSWHWTVDAGVTPSWSPAGDKLVFADLDLEELDFEIFVIDIDGGNPQRLTNNSADDIYPSWSPDGTEILFQSDRDGNTEIYSMDADGSNPTPVTPSSYSSNCPSWSPDGEKIAFHSFKDNDTSEIYTMDLASGDITRVTTDSSRDLCPRWAPPKRGLKVDADLLVIPSSSTLEPLSFQEISALAQTATVRIETDTAFGSGFVIGADGSNVRQVINTSTRDVMPRWAPRKQGVSVSESSIIIDSAVTPGAKTFRDITAGARSAVVRIETEDGMGSGFIFDDAGHILTNNHVITGAASLTVHLDDGTSHHARLVGRDLVHDLAVVKIDAPDLPWLELGELSTTPLASDVLVLGFPLMAEDISVTRGLVSAIKWDKGRTVIWIQTDSAINPGNSGGPLMNLHGQVVGLVSAKLVDINVEGVGFAISSNTIKLYLDRLRAGETITS